MQYRTRPVARGPAMSPARQLDPQALARAAPTYLAEPGDPALGALLEVCEPAEVLAAIKAGTLSAIKAGTLPATAPGPADSPARRRALEAAFGRWRLRLPWLPDDAGLAYARRDGIRLVCP